jgi:threonine/homoserine/homoserine lactone efflux protein
MPSTGAILAFLAASLVLVAIPGPSVLFIVGRALAHGRRAALASVAGNTTGVAVLVVVVALGLGAVAAASATVFTAIKLAGAAYLIWLGVHTIRTRGDLVAALGRPGVAAGRRVYLQGVLVGLTNPKALVFFAAVLPQFLGPQTPNPALQLLTFGLLFCLTAAVLDSAWGLVAGAARDWFATSPARLRRMGGAGGLVLVGMGVGLAFSGRHD